MFLSVCAELQSMTALLSPASGDGGAIFAWNALARAIATLEAHARDLRTATLHDVLIDDSASADAEATQSTREVSAASALHEVLDALAFLARFLLALTDKQQSDSTSASASEPAIALTPHLLAAYRHVFAASHPWIVQRAITDGFAASPVTAQAFFAALRRGNERSVRTDAALVDSLRVCGRELETLHRQLEEHLVEASHTL